MIVTRKIGVPRDGSVPTILYGYGGFNISVTPAFSPATLVWLELGGALPWRTFAAAASTVRLGISPELKPRSKMCSMISSRRRVSDRAALHFEGEACHLRWQQRGYSLVHAWSAPTLRRGDRGRGGADMLRFQKFTIGWAWTPDYGSSDEPTRSSTCARIRRCTTCGRARRIRDADRHGRP